MVGVCTRKVLLLLHLPAWRVQVFVGASRRLHRVISLVAVKYSSNVFQIRQDIRLRIHCIMNAGLRIEELAQLILHL